MPSVSVKVLDDICENFCDRIEAQHATTVAIIQLQMQLPCLLFLELSAFGFRNAVIVCSKYLWTVFF